jgi:hypothetical protein
MSTPRRRILRPAAPPPDPAQRTRQLEKLRARRERSQAALQRWQSRLRRAFNAVEKEQTLLVRLERQLARLENT